MEIDADRATAEYIDRTMAPLRAAFLPQVVAVMEEQMSGPCAAEVAAFDRFSDYAAQDDWQAIVFDTAPTGQALRLLELPMDWSKQFDVKVSATVDGAEDCQSFGHRLLFCNSCARCPSPSS